MTNRFRTIFFIAQGLVVGQLCSLAKLSTAQTLYFSLVLAAITAGVALTAFIDADKK